MLKHYKNLPIGIKNVIIISLAISFALILTFVILINREIKALKASLKDKIEFSSKVIAANAVVAIEFGDKKGGGKMISSLDSLPEVLVAAIYDKNNNEFAKYQKSNSVLDFRWCRAFYYFEYVFISS